MPPWLLTRRPYFSLRHQPPLSISISVYFHPNASLLTSHHPTGLPPPARRLSWAVPGALSYCAISPFLLHLINFPTIFSFSLCSFSLVNFIYLSPRLAHHHLPPLCPRPMRATDPSPILSRSRQLLKTQSCEGGECHRDGSQVNRTARIAGKLLPHDQPSSIVEQQVVVTTNRHSGHSAATSDFHSA